MSQEEKPKTRNQSYRERMVALLRDIKMKSGCVICGYKEHWAALDFHHTNPSEKENLVSKLVSQGCFAAAMEEVQKCIVLCANCHRIHHYEENSVKIQPLTTNQLPEHAGQR